MIPWERDIYVGLLKQHLEEEEIKRKQRKLMPSPNTKLTEPLDIGM